MKKFFLCFAVISLFFFIASCGESSTSSNEKPDSGDTVNDEDTADTDSSDTNPDNPDSDDPDTGATGKCEISNSYTNSSFDQYFRFKGESLVNDLNKILEDPSSAKYNEDVTTRLYLSQKYTFEKTEGSKDGDKIMAQIQNYLGDTSTSKILNKFKGEGVYLSTFKIVPIGDFYSSVNLYAMTALPNSVIKSAEKDPNGRINLKSAPDVIVFSIEYQNVETEKAWLKTCPVAVTKTSGENGSAQLCPGEDGSFAADQTVKIGVNAELTTDEKDILAFADNAKSIEELCVINCGDVNGEFDSEKKECRCKKGYTWNAGSYECVEEKDDTDTTPDEDSDTIPEPSDDDADTVPEQNDDDADTGVVEPTEAEKCAAVGGTWNAETSKCSKTVNCDPLSIDHAEWNGAFSYTQDYVNGAWLTVTDEGYLYESIATIYSENPGTCRFKCSANYNWTGSHCVDNCYGNPCNDRENAIPDTCIATGQQTFKCGCVDGYYWTGVSCDKTDETICTEAGGTWSAGTNKCTKTVNCAPIPATDTHTAWNGETSYTQTYSADGWIPNNVTTEYNETVGVCHYKCAANYFRKNGVCTNGCESNSCNGDHVVSGSCTPTGADTFYCDCENGYVWSDNACNPLSETSCVLAGGTWNASNGSCTRTVECSPISIEYATWNGSPIYTQTYANGTWTPANVATEYSETPGECHFKCNSNYHYVNGICEVKPEKKCEWEEGTWNEETGKCTRSFDCNETSPLSEHAVWNGPTSFTQEYVMGTGWTGWVNSEYNETPGTCHYVCEENYYPNNSNPANCINPCDGNEWCQRVPHAVDGSCSAIDAINYTCDCEEGYVWMPDKPIYDLEKCEATLATKCTEAGGTWNASLNKCIKNCDDKPENTEWNGSSTYVSTYSDEGTWSYVGTVLSDEQGDCHFKCNENYFWNGDYCKNPCDSDPCTEHSIGCTPTGYDSYICECEENYYQFYSACINGCEHGGGNDVCSGKENADSCIPTGYNSYTCGCVEGYEWNAESKTCDLIPCTIDDSFAASDYDEHFLFNGFGELNDINDSECSATIIYSTELDLIGDDYDFIKSNSVFGTAFVDDGGSLNFIVQKYDNSYTNFVSVSAYVPAENLNSAAISANGKMNVDALRASVETINILNSGEERVAKLCTIAVSRFTENDFTTGNGRVQICFVGENRTFAVGELLNIGVEAELNSDPDSVTEASEAFGKEVCSFSCMNANAEVKDPETGRCGCVDGYTWDGEKCLNNCSASGTFPCIDSETGLIWSSKSTGITGENIVSHCDDLSEGNFNDWQAPTISQLRTLVVNCPTLEPDGDCGVTDSCLESTCWNGDNCACSEASDNKLGDSRLLSSSSNDNGVYYAIWHGGFYGAGCTLIAWPSDGVDEVRCTRCSDGKVWNPLTATCVNISEGAELDCAATDIEHTVWNDNGANGKVTQTWDGSQWTPAVPETTYDEEPGICHFICEDGYTWDGEKCLNNCSASSDFPCIDPDTSLIWSSKSTGITGTNIVSHCDNLYEGNFNHWQAPTISQLRTLVQSGYCGTLEPGGSCGVTDDCLDSACYDGDNCACSEASDNKLGDSELLSSSSNNSGVYYSMFYGGFYAAGSTLIAWPTSADDVRCTRCADGKVWNGTECLP